MFKKILCSFSPTLTIEKKTDLEHAIDILDEAITVMEADNNDIRIKFRKKYHDNRTCSG
jgi:hypothetical protein